MQQYSQIYNQLLTLRQNLPEERHVHRRYVEEYHRLLKLLEERGVVLVGEYRITESNLESLSGIYRPKTGWRAIGDKHCERSFLLMKLDALLLAIQPQEEKPHMGF